MSKKNTKVERILPSHRAEFVKLLKRMSGRYDLCTVFMDFIQMAAISIANGSDPYRIYTSQEIWEKREKRYLNIVKKYEKDDRMLFPTIFSEMVLAMEHEVASGEYRDILGETFHELELHNKWRGQFFTPISLGRLLGELTVDNAAIRNAIETYGFVSANEPACGSGALILGLVSAVRRMEYNPAQHCLLYASDLDERCVWMTYIQCSLYGVPAVILQQNTLSLQVFDDPWYSPAYTWGLWKSRERYAETVKIEISEVMEMLEA